MKVRALQTFASPVATAVTGDIFDVDPEVGLAWAKAGLVERLAPAPETTTMRRAPEAAVTRKARL